MDQCIFIEEEEEEDGPISSVEKQIDKVTREY